MTRLNWEKANRTIKKRPMTVKPRPHHSCPTCNAPIYDHRPVCILCFKAGKFPTQFWKKNQLVENLPGVTIENKRKQSLARLKKLWNKYRMTRKPLIKRMMKEKINEEQTYYQQLCLNPENRQLKADVGYGNSRSNRYINNSSGFASAM